MISLKGTRLGQFYTGYKIFKDQGVLNIIWTIPGHRKRDRKWPKILKEVHIKTSDKDSRKITVTHLINKIWNSKIKGTTEIKESFLIVKLLILLYK